jgi:hypothetical protein
VLGLDDLFIDVVYWTRKLIRRWRYYEKVKRADEQRLYTISEKPLTIMVPAWNEVGVVGEMARLAASTIDYENYQIFVGTYPNDAETQADVDAVCLHYPHYRICVQQQSMWERACSRRGRQPQRKIIRPRASKRPASPVALQPT